MKEPKSEIIKVNDESSPRKNNFPTSMSIQLPDNIPLTVDINFYKFRHIRHKLVSVLQRVKWERTEKLIISNISTAGDLEEIAQYFDRCSILTKLTLRTIYIYIYIL